MHNRKTKARDVIEGAIVICIMLLAMSGNLKTMLLMGAILVSLIAINCILQTIDERGRSRRDIKRTRKKAVSEMRSAS